MESSETSMIGDSGPGVWDPEDAPKGLFSNWYSLRSTVLSAAK